MANSERISCSEDNPRIIRSFEKYFEFPPMNTFYEKVISNQYQDFWIYAYGSLLWFPDFKWGDRILGYVENPGRVATLIPCAGEKTWGAIYRITGREEKIEAYEKMIKREVEQGYRFALTDFVTVSTAPHHQESRTIKAVVYVALPETSTNFTPVPVEIQAYQIFRASGINGPNRTYLEKIAHFLRTEILPTFPNDEHARKDTTILLADLVEEFVHGKRQLTPADEELARPQLHNTKSNTSLAH